MRFENKTICTGTDAIKEELDEYCKNVIDRFNPACIILYGSRAKGTFTNTSDIDIIVISNNFEQDFLSRIKYLIDANTSMLPIEPLGYTILRQCCAPAKLPHWMLYGKDCRYMVKIISII